MKKLTILTAAAAVLMLFAVRILLNTRPAAAQQACPVQSPYPRVKQGLISTPVLSNRFGSDTGQCVVTNDAAFAPTRIPSYDSLLSMYYTQAKTNSYVTKEPLISGDPTPATESDIPLNGTTGHLYNITGNLNINNNIPGNNSGVIFVNGNLTINPTNHKLTTGADAGLVFVVGKDITINPQVTQIDAVLIAQGHIYTAAAGSDCSHSSPVTTVQLVVNGSLISLDNSKDIEFCRSLPTLPIDLNNTMPAEVINNQPKYLVLLRNLYADIAQKWSETSEIVPTPTPTPATSPTAPPCTRNGKKCSAGSDCCSGRCTGSPPVCTTGGPAF